VIHRRGPWRSLEAVEYATLEWVDWNRRLLEPIGHVPRAEAEAAYYAARRNLQHSPPDSNQPASEELGTAHWACERSWHPRLNKMPPVHQADTQAKPWTWKYAFG
jgi:hypothetical protein